MRNDPKTLMLVEDNPDHAELVKRTLGDLFATNHIIHFMDGQTALDYLLHQGNYQNPETSPRPDLILLDLRLPGLDGISVLQQIKESPDLRTIPVVILTTSRADRDLLQAYQNHANSYLVKPVRFEEFERLMNDLGVYWLSWNSHPII